MLAFYPGTRATAERIDVLTAAINSLTEVSRLMFYVPHCDDANRY